MFFCATCLALSIPSCGDAPFASGLSGFDTDSLVAEFEGFSASQRSTTQPSLSPSAEVVPQEKHKKKHKKQKDEKEKHKKHKHKKEKHKKEKHKKEKHKKEKERPAVHEAMGDDERLEAGGEAKADEEGRLAAGAAAAAAQEGSPRPEAVAAPQQPQPSEPAAILPQCAPLFPWNRPPSIVDSIIGDRFFF